MLGDVLLITDKHKKAAGQIVEKMNGLGQDKYIIAISGESGSGKTELAHVLAKHFKDEGKLAKVMHIDNYYKVPPKERTAWREEHGFDSVGLDEYNWDLISKVIDDFKNDRECQMPCVDLLTDQVDQLITDFNGICYLIIEGLYSIQVPADFKAFITLTYHDTKNAQLVRGKEPQNEFRLNVLKHEHKAVQSLKPRADYLITKDFDLIAPGEISSN